MIIALRKMKLIDAHVHLSDAEYAGHIDELIADAKNAGVTALSDKFNGLKNLPKRP